MRIIVDKTGPDHEPTEETKWYAQLHGYIYGCPIDYAFGPTPEKALENLILLLTASGHPVE
jgi:hypothetical protein